MALYPDLSIYRYVFPSLCLSLSLDSFVPSLLCCPSLFLYFALFVFLPGLLCIVSFVFICFVRSFVIPFFISLFLPLFLPSFLPFFSDSLLSVCRSLSICRLRIFRHICLSSRLNVFFMFFIYRALSCPPYSYIYMCSIS